MPATGDPQGAAHALADAVESFVAECGLPTTLTGLGVGASAEELKRLAGLAFADPSHQPNPVAIESPAALEEALGALR